MKTVFRFERHLFIGLVSFFVLSAAFTGCGTNYDDDIDALNLKADSIANALKAQENALAELRTTVNNLKTEINNLNTITNVDDYGNGFRIQFSNGKNYNIESGAKGADTEKTAPYGSSTKTDFGHW